MSLIILGAGYPLALAALVLVDWLSGWTVSEAFGRPYPGGDDAR